MYARGWMNLDSLRFGIRYPYEVIVNKVIGDLIHHDKSTIYASLVESTPVEVSKHCGNARGSTASNRFKFVYEPVHDISNNVVCATSKASDQPAHTRSLIRAFASRLSIL